MTLILRSVKGSKLTISEMDGNLTYLQNLALSGSSSGGTGHPSGSNTQVQFNDNGSFGGNTGFTFDKNTNHVNIDGSLSATNLVTGYIFSNPKNITGTINVPDNSNSLIIGPNVTFDPNSDITIGVNSDLTIFDPLDWLFTGNTSGDSIGQIWVDDLYAGSITATTYYGDGSNLTGIAAGAGVISVTYNQLVDKITGQTLTAGTTYVITDFRTCYDQPDFNSYGGEILGNNYKQSIIEPIVVFATSANTISTTAYQPAYPKDRIQYDWTFNRTERTQGVAYGRISERIDEFNNRTDYDHRTILFKRYQYIEIDFNSPYEGTVSVSPNSGTEMNVSGTGTVFTGLTPGQYVGFNNGNDFRAYEITSISGNTLMVITGLTNVNFGGGIQMFPAYGQSDTSYRQNNITTAYTEYYTFDYNDFNVNNHIGNYANSYYYDENSFILANNVFQGRYRNNTFGDMCFNNSFNDDCENNTIGNYFYNNSTDDDFDGNLIGNRFYDNRITSNFQNNRIGENFYSNYIVQNDFNRNNIMNDFRENIISGNDFQNNEIGSQFNNNVIRYGQFYKNDIGNGYNENTVYSDFYGNLIGNGFYANSIYFDFYDNIIGGNYNNNTLGDINNLNSNSFYRNQIGANFYSNDISGQTNDNVIGNTFENNTIYDNFAHNKISNEFKGNMMLDSFEENNIGSFVGGNQFSGGTYSNNIGNTTFANDFLGNVSNNSWGNNFHDNTVGINFYGNLIGNSFNFNTIGEDFYGNNIQNYFNYNTIGDGFQTNQIGNYFGNNTIGDNFGYGYANPQGNRIGNNFYNNTIGEYFYNNSIPDNFKENTIGNYFQWNVISTDVNYTDFTINSGNITGFIYTTTGNTAIDGIYNGLSGTTTGLGKEATFNIEVSGGTVVGVTGNTEGVLYATGDSITILGTQIGGVTGVISGFSTNNLSVKIYKPADSTYEFPENETEMDYLIANSPLFDTYYSNNIQGVSYSTKVGTDQNNYAMVIEGYIKIPSGDTYYFGLSSDDGSDAFINGVKVADWYGAHGDNGNVPDGNQYPISLTAGTYPIKVRLQERSGQDIVNLLYSLDGLSWNIIPDNWFPYNQSGSTGVYTGVTATGVTSGQSATFDITVVDNLVTDVQVNDGGVGYLIGDELVVSGSLFGGTNGVDDIVMTVGSIYSDDITITVTGATSYSLFYDHYTKQIFERRLGDKRVSFYDEEDILNIDSVYEISGYIPVYSQSLTFPYTYTSFNFRCDGGYTNNGGTTNETVNNTQELVTLFNNNFRSFGYFFDNNDGTIGLYIKPSLKQQYCPNGTYTIFVFED
jgi:hypothetical protein